MTYNEILDCFPNLQKMFKDINIWLYRVPNTASSKFVINNEEARTLTEFLASIQDALEEQESSNAE